MSTSFGTSIQHINSDSPVQLIPSQGTYSVANNNSKNSRPTTATVSSITSVGIDFEKVGNDSQIITSEYDRPRVLIINTKISPLDLDSMDDLHNPALPLREVVEYHCGEKTAKGSEVMWVELAELIYKNYYNYVGFIVVHTVDTMVYTATALSFMLMNLSKPVIFTGCHIPRDYVHTDFNRNLILSMLFAATQSISEVMIIFAEKMLRANRATKISSVSLMPFVSPHFSPLAYMLGDRVSLDVDRLRPAAIGRFHVFRNMSGKVLVVKFVPQMRKSLLIDLVKNTTANAIVMCGFGSGNFPSHGGAVHAAAVLAKEKGIIVAVCTQVKYGSVDITCYEAGRQLVDTGVVGCNDMTVETTVIKLKFLLGLGLSIEKVKKLLVEDLRGEISASSGLNTKLELRDPMMDI